MNNIKHIAVVGSLHHDIIVHAASLPRLGETAVGRSWTTKRGGKGANQAAQAAYHGAHVYMVGRVGSDAEGSGLIASLKGAGVDTQYVTVDTAGASGLSVAVVTGEGDYGAVIVSGTNQHVGGEDLRVADAVIQSASLLVLQLELPLETVTEAAALAQAHQVPVLLNAAPAYPLPPRLSAAVNILVVNQIEAEMLTGLPVSSKAEAENALTLLQGTVPAVIITLGDQGLVFSNQVGSCTYLPAHEIKLVDTHGAGDSFVGALGARLSAGDAFAEAVTYANAAAALRVSTEGSDFVEPAAVERFLERYSDTD